MGNTWLGGSASGGKSTKTTDGRQTTEHQGVGGKNSGEKSLWSGTNQRERSDPRPKEIFKRQTDSSQRGTKEDDKGTWNSHCGTQHPVGAVKGTGDGDMRLTAGKHRDWGPVGYKTHQRYSHVKDLGLHCMGNGGRESTPRGDCRFLEVCGGMGG